VKLIKAIFFQTLSYMLFMTAFLSHLKLWNHSSSHTQTMKSSACENGVGIQYFRDCHSFFQQMMLPVTLLLIFMYTAWTACTEHQCL
jgi:hypothetical protein